MPELKERHCCQTVERLDQTKADQYLKLINSAWLMDFDKQVLSLNAEFENYYQTMVFANAVAKVAQQQNHHPEMIISYRHCKVFYTTHSITGLSVNDFICAAQIDEHLANQIASSTDD
jgi:4a-hydroxytetrahydrobiopterin dehydratase